MNRCEECGEFHTKSWADEKFGCRRDRLPKIKIRHGLRGDCHDYRDDLARFPGDPQAYTDGPRAVKRLLDQRLREGWTIRDPSEVRSKPPEPTSSFAREAYNRAKAKGFVPDGEKS